MGNGSVMGSTLFFLVFAAICIYSWRWQKERLAIKDQPNSEHRRRQASQLGWRYDGSYDGDIRYRFFSATSHSHAWELRCDSDASSSSSVPKMIWEVASLAASRTEFMVESAKGLDLMQSAIGRSMAASASMLSRAVGASDNGYADFLKSASDQSVGSSRLRQKFSIRARSARDASHLFTAETEALLLHWPRAAGKSFDPFRHVTIIHDAKSFRIELKYDTSDMPIFEHIVKIGDALACHIKLRR